MGCTKHMWYGYNSELGKTCWAGFFHISNDLICACDWSKKQFIEDCTTSFILSSKVINICVTCSVLTLSFLCIPAKVCLQIEKIGGNGANISSLSKLILSHTYNILKFIPLNFKVIWRIINIIICFGKLYDYVLSMSQCVLQNLYRD